MRPFLSSLRILICESAAAKRSSTITSVSTPAYTGARARCQSLSAPSHVRAYASSSATARRPLRLTNTRAMSSSAAEIPSGKVDAGESEAKPTVVAEPVVEKEEEPKDDESKEEKDDEDEDEDEDEPKLPPLTAQQFREFNRMADHMDYFHNHFRQIWTMMYTACENKKRPAGMSIRRFLDEGLQFISMLTTHHSIEEAHVFPMLAKRMPEFQQPDKRGKLSGPATKGSAKAAALVRQHRDIHKGMDAFEDYLRRCRNSETELEMSVLKTQMDTWGTVLWQHLDEEVAALGAENMRKHWTIEEVRRMRM